MGRDPWRVTRRPGLVGLLQAMLLLEACGGLLPLTYGMASRAHSAGPMADLGRSLGGALAVVGAAWMLLLGWAAIGVGRRRTAAGGVAIMVNGLLVIAVVLDRMGSWRAISSGAFAIACVVVLTRPAVREWVFDDPT